MIRPWRAIGLLFTGLLAADPAAAADDASASEHGQQLAAVCAGCHAPGAAAGGFPDIWRLDEQALTARLLDYRQDLGAPTLMNRIAKGYSPDELKLIAAAIAAAATAVQR